jgi:DNA-directed RNA polymerase specialized sigma24 family protein
MTAEEYVRQIAKIDALILNKQADYRRWKEIATGFGSFSVGDKVQGSKNLQQIPDAIGRYIDIESEVERLKQTRLEIIGTLEQLPTDKYEVLFRYYVLGHSLIEIAFHLKKSYERTKVIKREALNMVQRILDERG